MGKGMFSSVNERQQVLLVFLIEIILIALIGTLMTYGPEANANLLKNHTGPGDKSSQKSDDPLRIYPSITMITQDHDRKLRTLLLNMRNGGPGHALTLICIESFLIVGMLAEFECAPNVANVEGNYISHHNRKQHPPIIPIPILYQDVHVMIWIGFGFLMTFLKRYGQSAAGLTFLVAAVLVQVALVCDGVTEILMGNKAYLSLEGLLNADVAVAAPLISMGAVLGKTTYMQLIFMGIMELIVFSINMYVGQNLFMAVDAGGSMFVHVFGAYFGLAVSYVFGAKKEPKENDDEGSSYQSDIFAMIGTLFLWLFWPSFNSAGLTGDDQQRAIINTLLSISVSCVTAFAVSSLVSNNKFNMVHVQNSTLAGGVAIGTAAGMMCEGAGAMIIGGISGVISVLGYKYLTPAIQKRFRIHDTCGVHNLHGMPGVLAGLYGAFMAVIAKEATYDYSLYDIFPARVPSSGEKLVEIRKHMDGILPGLGRTEYQQAGFQLLALVVTLGISIVSGLITGHLMHVPMCGLVSEEQKFNDNVVWEMEEKDSDNRANVQIAMGHI